MFDKSKIKDMVHKYYWEEDINCATTSIKALSTIFSISLSDQVIDSALGLHGSGKFGAQCGLVEGPLLFFGIYGRSLNLENNKIIDICYNFASEFESYFNSLLCRDLRPNGFNEDDPEHLCEKMTVDAIFFTADYIKRNFQ